MSDSTESKTAPLWPSGNKPDACEGCVYHRRRVHGAKFQFVAGHGPRDARLALFAEAPGSHEVGKGCTPLCVHAEGEPLVGPTGSVVSEAGCGRDVAFRSNIRKCVPPEKEVASEQAASIAHCVKAYLVPEVQAFGEEWRHIIFLGAEALEAWTGLAKIAKYHQSVFTRAEVEALRAIADLPDSPRDKAVAEEEVEEDEEDDSD